MVFTDASGFTALTEKLSLLPFGSERLGSFLNEFFGALIDIDVQIGRVRTILKQKGYADSTLVWLASDNEPEVNAPNGFIDPEIAGGYFGGPGEARPLRGRKRDYWEGGHRVPGILEYPPLIRANSVSRHTMVTTDLLPTIMDLLDVARPTSQAAWGLDGRSVVPAMRGEAPESYNEFGRGWLFWRQPSALGGAFRLAPGESIIKCQYSSRRAQ